MSKRLWIAWGWQRRNISLSSALGASLVEFNNDSSRWIRYPLLSFMTLKAIIKEKPDVIFSQNPSIVLAGLIGIVGKLLGTPTIIDAHNAGLFPLEGSYKLLNKVALRINALADIVIVSNDSLKSYLEDYNVQSVTIPDPIPKIISKNTYKVPTNKFNIVFVCSWASDEPYEEVFKAAEFLDNSFLIHITGKYKAQVNDRASTIPSNIILTGYLTNDEYDSLLSASDAVMVLTTRDDCLVCGAYEAVAAEKPMILSNTLALRKHFSSGGIFTDNTADMIAKNLLAVKDSYIDLLAEIKSLKKIRTKDIEKTIHDFSHDITTLVNSKNKNLSHN